MLHQLEQPSSRAFHLSAQTTRTNTTPMASQFAMPCSEPIPAEHILTPADVMTLFLRSLLQSADAFLGKPIDGAVLTVPGWFEPVQMDDLHETASAAGIRVLLQLLEDAGSAALCLCQCRHDNDNDDNDNDGTVRCWPEPHAACGRLGRIITVIVDRFVLFVLCPVFVVCCTVLQ
jgi:Hsp70 protein